MSHSSTFPLPLSFAPLEGITGWMFRHIHQELFPGVFRYYTPFYAPTADSPLSGRGLADMAPEHNQGVPVIPQLLTSKAEDFLAASERLADLGYDEVNLNLGCPSGTVVAKGKGAGFLARPQDLDKFFDLVFSSPRLKLKVSVKTRVGMHAEEEWPALLAIFNRYPLSALIVHPRLRTDYYRGPVRRACITYALENTTLPLWYNGDLATPADCRETAAAFPGLAGLMAGRGLLRDPALARRLTGGSPLRQDEFIEFHNRLLEGYKTLYFGDRPVLGKLKELWAYWAPRFPAPEKPLKSMRKAKRLEDYMAAAELLLTGQRMLSAEEAAGRGVVPIASKPEVSL